MSAAPDPREVEAWAEAIGAELYQSLMESSADEWRRWRFLTDAAKETYRAEGARIVAAAILPALAEHDRRVRAGALRDAADEVTEMDRIGQSPYADISAHDYDQYRAHPAGHRLSLLDGFETRELIANWLRDRADDEASA